MPKRESFFMTFCKVSEAFGTTMDKEELLDLVVSSAIDTMGGMAACLFMADVDRDLFIPVAQKGLSDRYVHASPLKARRIVSGLVKEGHLAFEDATGDPRLEHREAKKAEGIASILTVPVVVKNETIGILSLYTSKKRKFTKAEIDFLKALANQGGIAIQQADLIERIRNNARLFLELAASINSTLDIKSVLDNMTTRMCEILGFDGASIRLLTEDGESLALVASCGLSDEFLAKGPTSGRESIAQAQADKTLVIEDVARDKRIKHRDETLAEGVASMISVPLKSRGEMIGLMRLFSGKKRAFDDDLITMVEALAHSGAVAIQNASMHLALEKDKESLEKDIWSHRQWF